MPHLAILVHSDDAFGPTDSLLGEIAAVWREDGFRVTVLHGPAADVEADAIVCHVDLTVVPSDYLALLRRYAIVINGRVTDISKRRISRNLVRRGDGYDGPVIVKTNANYGGLIESAMASRAGLGRRLRRALRDRLPWSWRSSLERYRIFDSPGRVPTPVWFNPDLVVERFLPERRNGLYCVRTWLFLGDQERVALFYSKDPIVKSEQIIGREPLSDVPDDLRQMRRELGFDYGKFDYAVVDGRTVLYDANRTPTLGVLPREPCLPWIRQLSKGISAYLDGAGRSAS